MKRMLWTLNRCTHENNIWYRNTQQYNPFDSIRLTTETEWIVNVDGATFAFVFVDDAYGEERNAI